MPNTQEMHPYVQLIWELITIEFMAKFFVVYFFVVWIALIIWVARDISNRSNSRCMQSLCVLLMILFTPLWVFLYLIIRPRKTVFEKYYAEVEGNLDILNEIVQERLEHKNELTCPSCDEAIEEDFIVCPSCKETLKQTCISCKKEIREGWKTCPYCKAKQKKKHKKKTD